MHAQNKQLFWWTISNNTILVQVSSRSRKRLQLAKNRTRARARLHSLSYAPALLEPALPLYYGNSTGLRYEAEEVRRCLKEGLKESPVMTHKETLVVANMKEN